jgi:hypothetical protein
MSLALFVVAIIIILYVLLRTVRKTPQETFAALREKVERLNAYGDYQTHMIERCTSAGPKSLNASQQAKLISMAEINRSLGERCDSIAGILIRVDDKSVPNERHISIINSSLNNIWSMRNDMDRELAQIDYESTAMRN